MSRKCQDNALKNCLLLEGLSSWRNFSRSPPQHICHVGWGVFRKTRAALSILNVSSSYRSAFAWLDGWTQRQFNKSLFWALSDKPFSPLDRHIDKCDTPRSGRGAELLSNGHKQAGNVSNKPPWGRAQYNSIQLHFISSNFHQLNFGSHISLLFGWVQSALGVIGNGFSL